MSQSACARHSWNVSVVHSIPGMSQCAGQLVQVRMLSIISLGLFFNLLFGSQLIKSYNPVVNISISDWNIPNDLKLTDPQLNVSKPIDLLFPNDMLCNGKISP